MLKKIFILSGVLLNLIFSQQKSFANEMKRPEKKDLTITIGFAPVYSPVFDGASDYGFSIFPDLRVNYKDRFFASVPEGIFYNAINEEDWKLGPIAKIRFGREEATGGSPFLISGETNALKGLGDIDSAIELGSFVQYSKDNIRSRVELRQGFGGHEGIVADANINYFNRVGPLSYSFGPRISFASAEFNNTYYGINQTQATNSGLNQYNANSGFNSYGVGGASTMPLTNSTAVTIFGGFDILGTPASDSPLITNRGDENQFVMGIAYGYRFGWNDGE
ncbi:MAG: MipA/OmpV family protein [Rickettsiales bacterium]|nr:MipA/OmpV family protein [Rickettsiales bacterium]